MGITAEQYRDQIEALLPQGDAWPRDASSNLRKLTDALAEEFARIDMRTDSLVLEAYPQTTIELLPDWERVAGLPDPCSDEEQTLQERRNALLAKLSSIGGQSRAFFIAVAEALGFEVTITEFRPFRVNYSAVGDALFDEEWLFVWRINAPETTIVHFRVGQSAVGEPLRKWGNDLLECVLGRLKPAHTHLLFGYS